MTWKCKQTKNKQKNNTIYILRNPGSSKPPSYEVQSEHSLTYTVVLRLYYIRKKHYMLLVANKIMVNHKVYVFVQMMCSFDLMHVLSVHSCMRNHTVFIHEMRR